MNEQKKPRIITIVARDDGRGDFDIHVDELVTRRLCWDELLGTIAVITHPQLSKQRDPLPPYARLEHIDDLLFKRDKWMELCPRKDPEIVARLIESKGDTEYAIETRASAWRKENGLS